MCYLQQLMVMPGTIAPHTYGGERLGTYKPYMSAGVVACLLANEQHEVATVIQQQPTGVTRCHDSYQTMTFAWCLHS
jgi:hypothetical protein